MVLCSLPQSGTIYWDHLLHTPCISSPNHRLHFAMHVHTIAVGFLLKVTHQGAAQDRKSSRLGRQNRSWSTQCVCTACRRAVRSRVSAGSKGKVSGSTRRKLSWPMRERNCRKQRSDCMTRTMKTAHLMWVNITCSLIVVSVTLSVHVLWSSVVNSK